MSTSDRPANLLAVLLPLLLSLAMPLHIMAENPGYAFWEDLTFVGVWFVLAAAVMLAIGLAIWRRLDKASVFATGMTLLLTANVLFRLPLQWAGMSVAGTESLLVQGTLHLFWVLLLVYFISRREHFRSVVHGALIAVVAFLAFDAGRIVLAGDDWSLSDNSTPVATTKVDSDHGMASRENRPDIFVIILDGYGRQDVLRKKYGVDNSGFISFLRGKGFYVADRSCANYGQTHLSLTALMGMRYLDTLRYSRMNGIDYRKHLKQQLMSEAVPTMLKNAGYRIFLDQSWYYHILPQPGSCEVLSTDSFALYEVVVWQNSSMRFVEKLFKYLGIKIKPSDNERFHDFILEQLRNAPAHLSIDEPVFVFMHVLSPHPPFLLGDANEADLARRAYNGYDGSHYYREGDEGPGDYVRRYASQVEALTVHVQRLIDTLLRMNDEMIIVLQSDHGPGAHMDFSSLARTDLDERFPILNAYYFSQADSSLFYPDITPVNSFRRIFSQLFEVDSALHPDRSAYSTWDEPHTLIDVTDSVRRTNSY